MPILSLPRIESHRLEGRIPRVKLCVPPFRDRLAKPFNRFFEPWREMAQALKKSVGGDGLNISANVYARRGEQGLIMSWVNYQARMDRGECCLSQKLQSKRRPQLVFV